MRQHKPIVLFYTDILSQVLSRKHDAKVLCVYVCRFFMVSLGVSDPTLFSA